MHLARTNSDTGPLKRAFLRLSMAHEFQTKER